MIPLVDGNERVDLWHPVFRARVAALCADPRMKGQLKVESAVRTRAEQVTLYQGWLAKQRGEPWAQGFNLAANPDQDLSPMWDMGPGKGSHHMQQPNGYGYAVDFNYSALTPDVKAILEPVAAEYLLWRSVPSEQWHYVMSPNDWTTVPQEDDIMTPEQEAKLDALTKKVDAIAATLHPSQKFRTQVDRIDKGVEGVLKLLATISGKIDDLKASIKPGAVLAKLDQILGYVRPKD